jgi:esterase
MSTPPPIQRFVPGDGLRLHALDWEQPGAPPLVLLHGFNGFAETFNRIAPRLRPIRRLVMPDLRGHGKSDWSPDGRYSAERFVADLAELADRLELGRFDLFGHSLGGLIAIAFVALHPERVSRLIVEDVRPRPPDPANQVFLAPEPPYTFDSWSAAAAYARPEWAGLPAEMLRHRLRYRLREQPDGTVTWRNDVRNLFPWRDRYEPLLTDPQWEFLARMKCPVLLIRGGRSTVLRREVAEQMAATNRRIELVEVAKAGHWVHREQAEVCAALVERFLCGVPSATP